jgi:hypothetical protein
VPLLARPAPAKPRQLKARRKTLAIHAITGVSLRRSSNRIKAKRREKPLVKEAEAFVRMNLRMIKDGQVVTAPRTWRWKLPCPCSTAAGRLLWSSLLLEKM